MKLLGILLLFLMSMDPVLCREPIGGAEDNASEDDVFYAAEKTLSHGFIASLPGGYNYVLKENGSNLSGGQSQRIGIARAIYQNKKIIIFDEFTSSLDDETESKIIESLIKLKQENLTMVISTHKKKLLHICDTVYDLSNNENN